MILRFWRTAVRPFTSFTDEMHDFEIANVLPHFGTVSRSSDIIAALSKQ